MDNETQATPMHIKSIYDAPCNSDVINRSLIIGAMVRAISSHDPIYEYANNKYIFVETLKYISSDDYDVMLNHIQSIVFEGVPVYA